jgi:glycosyltransferase involved in cell wall biosynthesis
MSDCPLRILFLDCAPFHGGAQESLRCLLQDLHSRGIPLQLLAADDAPGGLLEDAQRRALPAQAIRARHWPASPRGLWHFLQDRRACADSIAAAVADFAPTLIHANGLRAAMLLRPQLCAGVPVVIHDRDLRAPRSLVTQLARSLSPQVVAISQAVARKWSMLDAERVRVIANGFDLQAIAATEAVPRPFPPENIVVTLAADFVAWKNHRLFLDAFAILQRFQPAARAVIRGRVRDRAGEKLLRGLRRHCTRLGLDDSVLFVSEPGPALPWIAATDILAATACSEPFGRTPVEALSLGKPVVACAGAGHSEVLADCSVATLCQPKPAAIAAALARWTERIERARGAASDSGDIAATATAARDYAARFSLRVHSDAMRAFFQSLL